MYNFFFIRQSPCRVASMDFLNSRLPFVFIAHRFQQVFETKSFVRTKVLYINSFGLPKRARPSEGVHWRMSLMSSSLFFQLCPTCLVHLIWMILEMGGCGRTVAVL